MFSRSRNSMKLICILCCASRNQKSKMAGQKQEILISQPVYKIAAQFNGNTHVLKIKKFNEAISHTG